MIRRILSALSWPVVLTMVPIKRLAWRSQRLFVRGLLLEVTSAVDMALVMLNVQNGALLLTWRAFNKGNFLFGRAVMVVSHAAADAAAVMPGQLRGSHFMGLPIVGFESTVFMTNAGPINASQPARRVLRAHLDTEVLSEWHKNPDLEELRARSVEALNEWLDDAAWDSMFVIRATVTRVLGRLLADIDLDKALAESVTTAYLRRFAELSAFARHAPLMLGLLGTREAMRRDVYLPLKRLGIDPLVVDMMLFAGMFSVGTIVMSCVEWARREDIDYGSLATMQRVAFVTECLRLHPTVSSIHRIVEEPEELDICGELVRVRPGEEIAYPFVCANRDPAAFSEPERFRLDRRVEEVGRILSWSRGPHACPVRDLSVQVTVVMLDAMYSHKGDLRGLQLFNVEV